MKKTSATVTAISSLLTLGAAALFLIIYGPGKYSLDYLLDRSRF